MSQAVALELLYNSTQGEHWEWKNEAINGPKWSFSYPQADPCNDQNQVWQGISCSSPPNICKIQSCEIISLVLDDYNLNGTLPIEFFIQLTSLRDFKISFSHDLIGRIPSEIGSLYLLTSLSLYNNQLTGTIPMEIGSLSRLVSLYLDTNQLTGTIPSAIGSLSQLVTLHLYTNSLIGTIPSEIGSLSQLASLYLYLNHFTGSFPPEIGSLSMLVSLYLSDNQLTGTIPSTIGSLSQLVSITLYLNQLTGTLPFEFGSLSQLVTLSLDSNHLSGTIPSNICSLSRLVSLYLYTNQLTGTIPSEIGSLSQLVSLYFDTNQLTGTIPSEIGSLSQLSYLYLNNNQLTGTIPSSFSSFLDLLWLHLQVNQFHGLIPIPLASLPKLQQLFIHGNHFTGRIDTLVSSSPWNTSSSKLLNLDVSDNLFSGSIPSALFLPHLQSISLSLNCFEHELPSSICEAKEAMVISMDALGSAKDCKNVVTLPFTSVTLVRSLKGSIPECVWFLSNLEMLNLAGNGLRGTISTASFMPSLSSLTLSHNYLSGEIPSWLQKMNLSHLDLSHNKLTGDVNHFRHQEKETLGNELTIKSLDSESMSQSLSLTVNRLSGDLPHSFGKYEDLDLLSGNLFSCAYLPSNDESSDFVSCGSLQYDQAMMLMGGLLGLVVCLVSILFLWCRLVPYFRSRDDGRLKSVTNPHVYLRYLRYHTLPSSSQLHSILLFGRVLCHLIQSVCMLTLLCLCLSLPIYILKQLDVESGDPQYVTHYHIYNWLWTMAFLSGSTPVILLLLMYFVCLLYLIFVFNRLGSGTYLDTIPAVSSSSSHDLSSGHDPNNHFLRIILWIIFVVNLVIVGTMNGLYLWSTLLDLTSEVRIGIQFCFGLFSFLWNVTLRHGLPSKITNSMNGVWLLTRLHVMNSVIIPCMVTALSSPSCYQVSDLIDIFLTLLFVSFGFGV